MSFKPNALTFDQGLERIQAAYKKAGVKKTHEILTSRDKNAVVLTEQLGVSNVPGGFKKWQLPVYLDKPSQLFISVGSPDADVPLHSHDEGDGIRFIVGGSIIYNGVELTEGDWMFIPKGQKYSFKVGSRGVTQCYCYCCCCA